MIFIVSPFIQKAEVDEFCFKQCGKVLCGSIDLDPIGPCFPCREKDCPHEEKNISGEATFEGDEIYIRKLKSPKKD